MFRRTTWILLIIFVLLLGVTVIMQKNPALTAGLKTQTATAYPNLLVGYVPENIQNIDITPAEGNPFTLSKNPDQSWTIANQLMPVDSGKVEQLLTSLADLKVYSVLNTSLSKDVIGLTKPSYTIAYKLSDGTGKTIKVGQVTQTQSGYYVQVNDTAPVVIDKSALDPVIALLQVNSLIVPLPTADPLAAPPVDSGTPTP